MQEILHPVIFDWSGYTGVALFIGAYAALQSGLIRGAGYLYAFLNLLAASLLLLSLAKSFNLAAALTQICWIAISAFGILRIFLSNTAIRFNEEEREMLENKFPDVTKIAARRLFNAGLWMDVPRQTCLMREGESHGVLIYLARGTADVYARGRHIATALPGCFLGEMTVLEGIPATATVTLSVPARIFRIDADKLHHLCRRNPEFRLQLEKSLSSDMRMKLVAANERLHDHGVEGRSEPPNGSPAET